MTGRLRGRLFRQVYAAVLLTLGLFGAALAVARWLEPPRPEPGAAADDLAHLLALHWLLALTLLLAAAALAAYPLARRLTRRLERLQAHVERLGEGELGARVPVEGDDEVAALARSFNEAAARIEGLLRAQRQLLAHVSHELRTPLARLRVGVELLEGVGDAERRRIAGDVLELDALIGELLLASRLESGAPLERVEDVDLLGLVAEEAARTGADVAGDAVRVRGDARLLRRLVRNLLENARVHAAGVGVEAEVRDDGPLGARLAVRDRGPGVPEEQLERVFEPFQRLPGGSESGAGLGLALVRQIARRHGGEARCLSREGGGSLFEVRLPGA